MHRATPLTGLLLTALALAPTAVADGHTGVEPCEGGIAVVVDGDTLQCVGATASVGPCDGIYGVTLGEKSFCLDPLVWVESCGSNGFWVTVRGEPITVCFEWQ